MTKIMKNDGTWQPKPSGLKKGNLNAWKDMMFAARSVPEIDDIVVDKTTDGEIIGYLCIVADGYNSYWKRVAKSLIPKRGDWKDSSDYQLPQGAGYQGSPSVFYTERAAKAFLNDDIPF